MLGLGLACASHAGITTYGDGTGYDSQTRDWMTETGVDIDSNGLGTDGYFFFGDFDGVGGNLTYGGVGSELSAIASTLMTDVYPSYISTATIGAHANTKIGNWPGYEAIDNPLVGDGTDGVCGNITVNNAVGEALDFSVSGLGVDEILRVGIVTVLNDDTRARFDTPTISMTDGTDTATVTDLPNLSSSEDTTGPGWVFFDIDTDGDYTLLLPQGTSGGTDNSTAVGFGGMTFDTIPEPATLGLVAVFGGAVLFIRRRFML